MTRQHINSQILNNYEFLKMPINEISKNIKFPDLLKDENGNYLAFKNLGLVYAHEISKYADKISYSLANIDGAHVTHCYKDDKTGVHPVRIKLDDMSLIKDLCKFFMDITGFEIDEVTVTRNCPTSLSSVESKIEYNKYKHWLSETWHIDSFADGNFKIGIYLNDVYNEDHSPFEYWGNPNMDFYKSIIGHNVDSRFWQFKPDPEETTKVLAPKYTTMIFAPNFIHKGNYARNNGYRDFIMLGFNQKRERPDKKCEIVKSLLNMK